MNTCALALRELRREEKNLANEDSKLSKMQGFVKILLHYLQALKAHQSLSAGV